MIDFSAVLAAALVCTAAIISPGPNFVAITHRATTTPRIEALALAAGIASVSALWAAAALLGLGLLFTLIPWLFWSAKLLGAAYLVWLGMRLLRGSAHRAASPADVAAPSLTRAFRSGVLTNLSNPKAMVFYGSVFSATVPLHTNPATQATIVALVGSIALLWYGGMAWLLAGERAARIYRRGQRGIEAVCGALLLGLGLRQAFMTA